MYKPSTPKFMCVITLFGIIFIALGCSEKSTTNANHEQNVSTEANQSKVDRSSELVGSTFKCPPRPDTSSSDPARMKIYSSYTFFTGNRYEQEMVKLDSVYLVKVTLPSPFTNYRYFFDGNTLTLKYNYADGEEVVTNIPALYFPLKKKLILQAGWESEEICIEQ